MYKTLRTLLTASLFVSGAALADDGQALFNQLTCKTCHDPIIDQTSKNLGPSLVIIATAYYNDEDGLVEFLQGKAKPRISPETYMIMETQIAMILGDKPEENLRTLARFILSHAPIPADAPAAAPAASPAAQ